MNSGWSFFVLFCFLFCFVLFGLVIQFLNCCFQLIKTKRKVTRTRATTTMTTTTTTAEDSEGEDSQPKSGSQTYKSSVLGVKECNKLEVSFSICLLVIPNTYSLLKMSML